MARPTEHKVGPLRSRARTLPAPRAKNRSRARKISITVDARVIREIERQARRSGRTLSAEITDALAHELRRRHLRELIEQYEAEHGAISERELASIRKEWQG
jgi:hypothetical protein